MTEIEFQELQFMANTDIPSINEKQRAERTLRQYEANRQRRNSQRRNSQNGSRSNEEVEIVDGAIWAREILNS